VILLNCNVSVNTAIMAYCYDALSNVLTTVTDCVTRAVKKVL